MVNTGFSEVIGSWKIIEILLPRKSVSSSWFISRIFSSLKLISPPTILPGGFATNRITESAVTLLPQPLSPTTPRVSPGMIVKETSSTAFTTPARVKKYVLRLFTSSRCSAMFIPPLTSLLILGQRHRASHRPGTRRPAQKWSVRRWAPEFPRDENQREVVHPKSSGRYWSLGVVHQGQAG